MVKRLPAMQESQVRSLGWEDPLEKEMATHSSTLAWKIPWIEEPGRLQSMGSQGVKHDWVTSLHSLHVYIHTHICIYHVYMIFRNWDKFCSFVADMSMFYKLKNVHEV